MEFLLICSFLLFVIYAGLLLYYRSSWAQMEDFKPVIDQTPSTVITVIIPARNEETHLPLLLDSLNEQDYPKHLFEVFVIDDHSTDDTARVALKYPFCKLIYLKDHIPPGAINSYKKKAIEVGIKESKGELIVTTDADCVAPPNWLSSIASFFEANQPALIVMPVAINCSSKPIEIFQALDFMTLQGITGASVNKNMHSMCNGANLSYSRAAFNAVGGFAGIDNIASGDDMLLMHKIAVQCPNGIRFLKSPGVIVHTEPVHSVKAFFNQRIRWASKADKYNDKSIFWVLLLVYMFNVLLLLIPMISVFTNTKWTVINTEWSLFEGWLLLVALKTFVELFFLYPVSKFFNKQMLLWAFPIAQPFHIVYTVVAGWLGKFGSYHWKDRNVK